MWVWILFILAAANVPILPVSAAEDEGELEFFAQAGVPIGGVNCVIPNPIRISSWLYDRWMTILSGDFEGEVIQSEHIIDYNYAYNVFVEEGDEFLVVIERTEDGALQNAFIVEKARQKYLVWLVVLFVLVMALIGGRKDSGSDRIGPYRYCSSQIVLTDDFGWRESHFGVPGNLHRCDYRITIAD